MAKILVCDDEKSILNMLKMLLEKEKYEVICVENGKEVIEVLKNQIPDLIILDVMLPDESGFDILKKFPLCIKFL
jgi:Response regulator receiver domain.